MKKEAVIILAIVALAATGCKKHEEALRGMAPQTGMPGQLMLATGGDPHAGMKQMGIPAGATHKGTVTSTLNSNGYTYIEVDEKGEKEWLAVMETKIKIGATVEFPDSPPLTDFQSKSLKRTFGKIYFCEGIRVAS